MGKELAVASLSLLDLRPAFALGCRYGVQNDAQIHLSRLPGFDLEKLQKLSFFQNLKDSIVTLKGPCTVDIPSGSVVVFITRTLVSGAVGLAVLAIFGRLIRAAITSCYDRPKKKRNEIERTISLACLTVMTIVGSATFYWLGTTRLCNARIFELKLS